MKSQERLIVALDFETASEALALVATLQGRVGMFKVGSQLFTTVGPQIVKEIVASGTKVFLDLKFHDIPQQVAGAARAAAELGVSMFTVHASGGAEMMRRAVEAVSKVAEERQTTRTAIVAVSVLTSIDATTLAQVGVAGTPAEAVTRLVKLARESQVDGVVASSLEAQSIRQLVVDPGFLIVTPGIRPGGQLTESEDQKRVSTPGSALKAGSSYLVVGRPIAAAQDPVGATEAILTEMGAA